LVASNVVDTGEGADARIFAGSLYRTSGATAGASGDTTPFSVAEAGSLRLRYGAGPGAVGSYLVGACTADGTTGESTLQRQTWSGNVANFAGAYSGAILVSATAAGACDSLSDAGTFRWHPPPMIVTQSSNATQIAWSPDDGTECSVSGALASYGNLAS